jgi:hypothetical protein
MPLQRECTGKSRKGRTAAAGAVGAVLSSFASEPERNYR